jgi:AcrR family transcriptional regulator
MTTDGDHTRARLLTEARDLYLEVGFGKFSLREVARRCHVSAPAVYRHYDNKEALLREVCGEGFRIFSSYLLRALSAPTARERMLRSADQYLLFALENPLDYRVIFMGAAEDITLAPKKPKKDVPEPTFQFLVDRVRECMNEKVLKKGDPDELAIIIWTHVHGLASLRLSGHLLRIGNDAEFTRFYQRAAAQLLSGLGP